MESFSDRLNDQANRIALMIKMLESGETKVTDDMVDLVNKLDDSTKRYEEILKSENE